ncbi:uncharacterized protein DNG_05526 [Cephalotrichum gorgonifer]|uniref:NACHT domain-containing protein n=1 Tax=Cephalotrichum gorgonifer TaxID=2041049 RepID=A0AAE8SVU8_9PEZI|nr:uncharacterized protein DNG_05526 [Cephalotrichum gorgonifer]
MANAASIHIGNIEASGNARIVVANNVKSPARENTKDDCLRSLAFPGMGNRSDDVGPASTGTCQWLIQHDTYKRWAACDRGDLLWIRGKPGSGKSTLLKYALDNCRAGQGDLVLSFFFHDRGNELQRTALGLFRCLLHQVLKKAPAPDILSDLFGTFNERYKEIGEPGEKWQWHRRELQKHFESSLLKALESSSVWLFVDALDECGEENAVELFQWLKSLLRKLSATTLRQLRICITCRHYPILDRGYEFGICMEEENKEDIATYVRKELFYSPRLTESLVPSLIFSRASGVFMWARLVVARVRKLEREGASLNNIKKAVHSVPPELDKLYQELIQDMDKVSMKLVQWICLATRPLSTDELQLAMAIEADCPFRSWRQCRDALGVLSDGGGMETQIEALSRGLAELTPVDGRQVVQFIHQSVKDFFADKGFRPGSSTPIDTVIGMAHHRLCRICIRFLTMEELSRLISYDEDGEMGRLTSHEEEVLSFSNYALRSWAVHAKECDSRGVAQDDLLDLFAWPPSSDLAERWLRIREMSKGPSGYSYPSRGASLVHILSCCGIKGPLQAELQRLGKKRRTGGWAINWLWLTTSRVGAGVNSRDSDGRTPLSWAVEGGHEDVVKLLLETGKVDINAKDRRGETPLSRAVSHGNMAIIELLLKTGLADLNAKNREGQTPLTKAVTHLNEAIFELLFNTGEADIKLRTRDHNTLLSLATTRGAEAAVKLLLDTSKATIDSRDKGGQTPLSLAAASGNAGILKRLLATGKANVNSRDKEGQTPLACAARFGCEAAVRLLLDTRKVDVNSKDAHGWTPLSWAAAGGSEAVVKLLLDTGKVDVNWKASPGWTPLSIAAMKRHVAVIKLLLDTGKVDVDSKDESGLTPLALAATEGHDDAVELLLKTKVDINSKDARGWTPLSWAAAGGHGAVAKLLIDTGKADINSRDTAGLTPLSLAAALGHEAVVKLLLLTAEVDINSTDARGWGALSWAAAEGHEAVVKLLLETGRVDIESDGINGRKPLLLAAVAKHEGVVKLLKSTI